MIYSALTLSLQPQRTGLLFPFLHRRTATWTGASSGDRRLSRAGDAAFGLGGDRSRPSQSQRTTRRRRRRWRRRENLGMRVGRAASAGEDQDLGPRGMAREAADRWRSRLEEGGAAGRPRVAVAGGPAGAGCGSGRDPRFRGTGGAPFPSSSPTAMSHSGSDKKTHRGAIVISMVTTVARKIASPSSI
jgi:hypothetical protein